MSPDPSFDAFLEAVRRQDPAAATHLFDECVDRLSRMARQRLDPRLRGRVDPEDVVQSVFKSVFVRLSKGQYPNLGGWDGLWGLLIKVMYRKCSRWRAHFLTQKRNAGLEKSLVSQEGESAGNWEPTGREPDPSEELELEETLAGVLRGLKEHEQQMVHLAFEGLEANEIATRLTCQHHQVYRVLRLVRSQLEKRLA